jgi:hypothetical protein
VHGLEAPVLAAVADAEAPCLVVGRIRGGRDPR